MILEIFFKWLMQRKFKFETFNELLLKQEHRFNLLLLKLKTEQNYGQLQLLEDVVRRALLKILEVKGEVGTAMVKKDFDMNKELLAKIQAQSTQPTSTQSIPQTKPRFNVN
jgi:hypothetical protein